MVAREWKCKCPIGKKDGFIEYLKETGVKETSSTRGFLGAQVFARQADDKVEITLITYWEDASVIKAFAGEQIEKAKLYPEDWKYDLEPDLLVRHYEVVESTFRTRTGRVPR